MILRSIALLGLVVAAAMTVAAQNAAVPFTTAANAAPTITDHAGTSPGFQERHPRYQLRKGDTFDLDFTMTPEFNQTAAVQPDGYVTLKGAGSILVEGQTVPQLTDTLRAAYAKILHDPVITVSLKDFEKPYYIASGQVGKPGKYDLRGDLTVTEGVAIAGGFDEKSKHSQVVLFRPLPSGGFETKLINVKKLLASRDLSEDIRLEPGDLLYVPQNSISKIRPFLPSSGVGAYVGPGVL
jgi:polysaccharide export outer membrane protein